MAEDKYTPPRSLQNHQNPLLSFALQNLPLEDISQGVLLVPPPQRTEPKQFPEVGGAGLGAVLAAGELNQVPLEDSVPLYNTSELENRLNSSPAPNVPRSQQARPQPVPRPPPNPALHHLSKSISTCSPALLAEPPSSQTPPVPLSPVPQPQPPRNSSVIGKLFNSLNNTLFSSEAAAPTAPSPPEPSHTPASRQNYLGDTHLPFSGFPSDSALNGSLDSSPFLEPANYQGDLQKPVQSSSSVPTFYRTNEPNTFFQPPTSFTPLTTPSAKTFPTSDSFSGANPLSSNLPGPPPTTFYLGHQPSSSSEPAQSSSDFGYSQHPSALAPPTTFFSGPEPFPSESNPPLTSSSVPGLTSSNWLPQSSVAVGPSFSPAALSGPSELTSPVFCPLPSSNNSGPPPAAGVAPECPEFIPHLAPPPVSVASLQFPSSRSAFTDPAIIKPYKFGPPLNSTFSSPPAISTASGPPPKSGILGPPPTSTGLGPPPISGILDPPPTSTVSGPPPASSIFGPPPKSTFSGPPPTSAISGPPPTSASLGPPPSSTISSSPPTSTDFSGAPPRSSAILGPPPAFASVSGPPPTYNVISGPTQLSATISGPPPVSNVPVPLLRTAASSGPSPVFDPSLRPQKSHEISNPPQLSGISGPPAAYADFPGPPSTQSAILGPPPASAALSGVTSTSAFVSSLLASSPPVNSHGISTLVGPPSLPPASLEPPAIPPAQVGLSQTSSHGPPPISSAVLETTSSAVAPVRPTPLYAVPPGLYSTSASLIHPPPTSSISSVPPLSSSTPQDNIYLHSSPVESHSNPTPVGNHTTSSVHPATSGFLPPSSNFTSSSVPPPISSASSGPTKAFSPLSAPPSSRPPLSVGGQRVLNPFSLKSTGERISRQPGHVNSPAGTQGVITSSSPSQPAFVPPQPPVTPLSSSQLDSNTYSPQFSSHFSPTSSPSHTTSAPQSAANLNFTSQSEQACETSFTEASLIPTFTPSVPIAYGSPSSLHANIVPSAPPSDLVTSGEVIKPSLSSHFKPVVPIPSSPSNSIASSSPAPSKKSISPVPSKDLVAAATTPETSAPSLQLEPQLVPNGASSFSDFTGGIISSLPSFSPDPKLTSTTHTSLSSVSSPLNTDQNPIYPSASSRILPPTIPQSYPFPSSQTSSFTPQPGSSTIQLPLEASASTPPVSSPSPAQIVPSSNPSLPDSSPTPPQLFSSTSPPQLGSFFSERNNCFTGSAPNPVQVCPPSLPSGHSSYRLSTSLLKRPAYAPAPGLSTPLAPVPAPPQSDSHSQPESFAFTPTHISDPPLQHSLDEQSVTDSVSSTPKMVENIMYRPVYHHWFYKKGEEPRVQWVPFSMADSLNLEQSFTSNDEADDGRKVATDGGRFDVDITNRQRIPIYWEEPPTEVRRCSWFVKGPLDSKYIPYDENISALLEDQYRTACTQNDWNRRLDLADGEVIIISGPNSISHHQRSSSPDPWGNAPAMQVKPRVVKRGLDEFDIPEGEPDQVDHLLLIVHGIGKVCDLRFRSLVEVVDDLRNVSMSLVQSHWRRGSETGQVGRVELLPVEWHQALHTEAIDQRLANITLPSIPRARQFTNETLLDVFFYTSPVFCEKIVQAVGAELNRVYSLYIERNPGFTGGVSLGGHSLGSLILFDMLCHQKPRPHRPLQSSFSSFDEGDEDVPSLGCLKTRARLSRKMSYLTIGTAGTGQPYIVYPQLTFQPRAFFALGSPIGMFVTVRGIESLGEEFKFPTCPAFFNIFHPNDPVAYRIEGLINPELASIPAILIPHHKGRKRMHLELKETMAHVTAALKQKLVDTVRSTWNTVYQLAVFHRNDTAALQQHVDKVLEEELEGGVGDTGSERSEAPSPGLPVPSVGVLNGGRRIDYVLQEAPLETFNQYISAVRSHVCYWESEDTMLLMLKEIYAAKGIEADNCHIPQPLIHVGEPPDSDAFFPQHALSPLRELPPSLSQVD